MPASDARTYPQRQDRVLSVTATLLMLCVAVAFTARYIVDPIPTRLATANSSNNANAVYWPPESSLSGSAIAQLKRTDGKSLNDQAKDMLDRRFELLEYWRDAIDANLKLQLAFTIIALLILFSASPTLKTPGFDVELPVSWLQLIIPFALVFLWFRFGFALHNAIDNRLLLDVLARHSTEPGWSEDSVHSVRRLVRDASFGDAWFAAFRREFFLVDSDGPSMVHIGKLAFYALVIGLSHACALALLVNRSAYITLKRSGRALHFGLIGLAAAWFLVSHMQFHWDGPQPNWMQLLILWFAAIGTWILIRSSKLPRTPQPSSAPAIGLKTR